MRSCVCVCVQKQALIVLRANEFIQSVSVRSARITSNQTDTVMVSIITDATYIIHYGYLYRTIQQKVHHFRSSNIYLTFNHLNRFLGFPCALVLIIVVLPMCRCRIQSIELCSRTMYRFVARVFAVQNM